MLPVSRRCPSILFAAACVALLSFRNAFAQTAHYAGVETSLTSTSLSNPEGIAVDSSNNVYIVDTGNNRILKETPSGSGGYTETVISTAQTVSPEAASVDAAGNIYVVTGGQSGTVLKLTPKNGVYTSAVIYTSTASLHGVAVNAAGTALYAANTNDSSIYQFAYVSGSWIQQTTVTSIPFPYGLAIDANGNWYAAQLEGGTIYKHAPGFSAATFDGTTAVTGSFEAFGIAVDAAGDLFIDNPPNGSVVKENYVSASNYTASTLISGFVEPYGVAVDSNGVVYVANTSANTATALNPSALNFGSVAVGSTSATQTLAFVFDTAGTLNGTAPYQALLTGTGNLDYAVVAGSGTTCTAGATEMANATCTVSVTFTPAYPGARNGAVLLNGSTGTQAALAYVAGNGSGPQAAFTPVQSTLGSGLDLPEGIAADGAGNIYIADNQNFRIVKEAYANGVFTQSKAVGDAYVPIGVAVDGAGNLFVTDFGNRLLEEVYAGGVYTQTVIAAATGLSDPEGVAVDGAGNVYVADTQNNRVLKESYGGGVYTQSCVTGTGSSCTGSGLNNPQGVAVDGTGNLYIANTASKNIVKATYSGGSYTSSTIITTPYPPLSVTVDSSGSVYIVDGSHNVLKYVYSGGTYTQSTLATLTPNNSSTVYAFNASGIAVDGAGDVYVANSFGDNILLETVTTPPTVNFTTTQVGTTSPDSPEPVVVSNNGNQALTISGVSIATPFSLNSTCVGSIPTGGSCTQEYSYSPTQAKGIVYNSKIADNSLNASATQTVMLNGNATRGTQVIAFPPPAETGSYLNGTSIPITATSNAPGAVIKFTVTTTNVTGTFRATTVEPSGVLMLILQGTGSGTVSITASAQSTNDYYAATSVTDSFTVTMVNSPAAGSTLTDTPIGSSSTATVSVQVLTSVTLGSVVGLTQGAAGLDYTASTASGSCKIANSLPAGQVCSVTVTFSPRFAGPRYGAVELLDASGNIVGTTLLQANGLGPQAAFASVRSYVGSGLNLPNGVAVDGAGNVYITDANANRVIKEVYANGTYTQSPSTIGSSVNTQNSFYPVYIAVDGAGNLYISDYVNNVVVKEVYANGTYTQSPTTIGSGLNLPMGVAVDGSGNVYIADYGNDRVVKEIYANGVYTQSPTTIGSAVGQYAFGPVGVALDAAGDLYIADNDNSNVLKEVYANGTYTQSSTTLGNGLNDPDGIAVDGAGNVYITDTSNNRVVEEVYANGTYTQSTVTTLLQPLGVAVDGAGNVYTAYNGTRIALNTVSAPPTLTFPSTATGVTSAPIATTVTNLGNQPLVFPVPSTGLDPQTAANFVLETNSDTTCPVVNAGGTGGQIAADTSCTLSYVFAPTQVGTLTSTSVLTDNNLNVTGATQAITLTGPATQGTQTAQTINFPQPASVYPGSAALMATASSGLPVTYTLVSGPATLSGAMLSYTAPGTVMVTANQAGNVQYSAAPPVTISITVTQAIAMIDWSPATLKIYTGSPLDATILDATDSIPATISYTSYLMPSGSFTAATTSTVLGQGSYGLTATFTPQDALRYGIVQDTLLFTVQNMNAFVAHSVGAVNSFYNNVTQQSALTSGGGIGAAVDSAGNVWSIDKNGNGVSKFNNVGVFVADYTGVGGINGATALAIDGGGRIWITNGNGTISVLNIDGTQAGGGPVGAAANLSTPASVNVDANGSLWIANPGNNTVTEVIGVAAPVAAPSVAQVINSTEGTRP